LAGKKCKSEAPIAPEIIALCLAPLKIISKPPSGAGLRAHGAINCQCLGGFTQILSCVYLWFLAHSLFRTTSPNISRLEKVQLQKHHS
jgi:hypothetical protein